MKYEAHDTAWDEALRQAVDWSILLADDPDDDQLRARFDAWRNADPLHDGAWRQASHLDELMRQVPRQVPHERPAPVPVPAARPQPRLRVWHALAGTCFAALAWMFVPAILLHVQADIVTGPTSQADVRLDDGSTVRLAPGSAMRAEITSTARRVDLLAGEAFFEVVADPARPFQVAAHDTTVTVLGTGFNVRVGDHNTDVAVKHGRVQVQRGEPYASSNVLTSGQWVRLSESMPPSTGDISPDIVGSWSRTRLVAVDRPLTDVMDDLRRYYAGRIILLGSAPQDLSVTGVFDASDPIAAVELIVRPHGGTVRKVTPWLLIVSLN